MSQTINNNGIGFFGILTILFIAFKLLGIIEWSWWWVLSPIWISGLFVIFIIIIVIILMIIREIVK
jgi:hypothetical protein